jgi:hypothetical protein
VVTNARCYKKLRSIWNGIVDVAIGYATKQKRPCLRRKKPATLSKKPTDYQCWACCDRCDKWRRLPSDDNEPLDDEEYWYCSMAGSNCYEEGCEDAVETAPEMVDAPQPRETQVRPVVLVVINKSF